MKKSTFVLFKFFLIGFVLLLMNIARSSSLKLLSDPFLQLPTENSIRVVWFTEFLGSRHTVNYGEKLTETVAATTTKLTRTREDTDSWIGQQQGNGTVYSQPTLREIWRHEAEITGLKPGVRVPYQVTSLTEDGEPIQSDIFTLSPKPKAETPLKILLTSDHQLKPMTAANLQKVAETLDNLDAIFFAGDLVNIPDRASEWFDDNRGGAFFPCLQGRAFYPLKSNNIETVYQGGKLIQNIPLFPTIGNHEVMGAFDGDKGLKEQFSNPYPRPMAEKLYSEVAAQINPTNDPEIREQWLKDRTFNTVTYNEIFSLPNEDKNYYAITFGEIRLVVLYVTTIWRSPELHPNVRGRYREKEEDFNQPQNWGHGQFIFEPITPGSEQYHWLQQELESEAFKTAKYKIVMLHHPPHSLGGNIVPAYTDPVQIIEQDETGQIQSIRYEYPKDKDYIIRDVIPLLEKAGVQFVYYGHSHLWNRFISPSGMHFLESSNVGNSYGAAWGNNKRFVPSNFQEHYQEIGDPNGLEPVIPTLDPVLDEEGNPLPYIASNEITVFSILDTGTGTVSSYKFDVRDPESKVIKFDEFEIK